MVNYQETNNISNRVQCKSNNILNGFLGYDEISGILVGKGANVMLRDKHGSTALMRAAENSEFVNWNKLK